MKIFHAFLISAFAATTLAQAHEHFGAGVLDSNGNNNADAGEALQLVTRPAAGAIFHMLPKAIGQRYGGYFSLDEQPRLLFPNDYFTFAALSDGHALIEEPGHAANGSDIWMEITSVSGPAGGSFGYWSEQWSYTHTTPTVSFLSDEATGGFKFQLSEPLPDDPDGDPYGHIHDRGWTADIAGEYTIGFTLYDMSTSGPGGGPIHMPSETYYFTFVAVPEPGTTALLGLALAGGLVLWIRRRVERKA